MNTQIESVESRRLMAVTAYTADGVMNVHGDNLSNVIIVEKSANNSAVVVKSGLGTGQKVVQYIASATVKQINIYGYSGNDEIYIAQNVMQDVTANGGKGADLLVAGGGSAKLYGHGNWDMDPTGAHKSGTDDGSADTLIGGSGRTVMWGQKGNDRFQTSGSKKVSAYNVDIANGGDGDDIFDLFGVGQTTVYGNGGNDYFYMGKQATIVNGNEGLDTVDYSAFPVLGGVVVSLDGVSLSGALSNATRNHLIGSDVENAYATNYDDSIFGGQGLNMLYGRGGRDRIDGRGGSDVLYGGAENDTIIGDNGNDYIYGNEGHDDIHAGTGNDTVLGGVGDDNIYGDSGSDKLFGETGSDRIAGGEGFDTLVGGFGADVLFSIGGNIDYVYGDNLDGSGDYLTDYAHADYSSGAWLDKLIGIEQTQAS
ncbi:MAG: calcium-binding protein [Tepidisphaeraceae bacterium]